jgi:hypothetical protein
VDEAPDALKTLDEETSDCVEVETAGSLEMAVDWAEDRTVEAAVSLGETTN